VRYAKCSVLVVRPDKEAHWRCWLGRILNPGRALSS